MFTIRSLLCCGKQAAAIAADLGQFRAMQTMATNQVMSAAMIIMSTLSTRKSIKIFKGLWYINIETLSRIAYRNQVQAGLSHKECRTSTEKFIDPFPFGPHRPLCFLLSNQLSEIKVAYARVQIHVVATHDRRAVPELVHNVGDNDNWGRQICHEEVAHKLAGSHSGVTNRPRTSPKLSYQHKAVENEADPGAENARLAAESELIESVALLLPRVAESDVRETDAAPGENRRKSREREHPVKCRPLSG
jgi:hypothetical protein